MTIANAYALYGAIHLRQAASRPFLFSKTRMRMASAWKAIGDRVLR
jgi:hypothetical protein